MTLTHLSLFSGIGGLDLAAEWVGFATAGQCEFADYPTKVLEKHWPNVPRWRDIRTLTKESFYGRTGLRTVHIISGGFPCQPFSVAGKQKGKRDDRYLWPEMLRVISEIKPTWVLGENVPGILSIAGKTVCEDLEREGYAVTVFNFEAAAVGAPHRRDRVFFVANSKCGGRREKRECRSVETICSGRENNTVPSTQSGADVADTDNGSRPMRRNGELPAITEVERAGRDNGGRAPEYVTRKWWSTEPNVGRVAHGVPSRVDRLKCLGNAVVPQQAYPIFKAIYEIETGCYT